MTSVRQFLSVVLALVLFLPPMARSGELPSGPVSCSDENSGSPGNPLEPIAKVNGVAQAEYVRLLQEMRKLMGRNVYAGVDRIFGRIQELAKEGVVVEIEVWELGALAAQGLGDVGATLERYAGAVKVMAPMDAEDGAYEQFQAARDRAVHAMDQIEKSCGLVKGAISAETRQQALEREAYVRSRNAARNANRPFDQAPRRIFEPVEPPFDPALRKAIEFAQAKFLEEGRYSAWLPAGTYRIAGPDGKPTEFTVAPKKQAPSN